MNNKWMSIQEAAGSLSCSACHIRRMISTGKLHSRDIGVGKHRILRVQIPDAEPVTAPSTRRTKAYKPQILKDSCSPKYKK